MIVIRMKLKIKPKKTCHHKPVLSERKDKLMITNNTASGLLLSKLLMLQEYNSINVE